MPYIEGYEEQKAALARIKDNLSEIEKINEFIKSVNEYSSQTDNISYNVKITFGFEDGSIKRLTCPTIFNGNKEIFESAQKYKGLYVKKVREDAEEHNISLSTQDIEIIEWNFNSELKDEN